MDEGFRGSNSDSENQVERDASNFQEAQAELSGLTNRQHRRIEDPKTVQEQRMQRERAASVQMTALEAALQNEEYRVLHEEVVDLLTHRQNQTETALREAEKDLSEAKEAVEDMEDRAPRTSEGTMAFRTGDGRIVNPDGNEITSPEVDTIVWPDPDNTPSWEEYQAGRNAVDTAEARIATLRDYLVNVLGVAWGEITNPENPLSPDELEGWKGILEKEPEAAQQSNVAENLNSNDQSIAFAKPPLGAI